MKKIFLQTVDKVPSALLRLRFEPVCTSMYYPGSKPRRASHLALSIQSGQLFRQFEFAHKTDFVFKLIFLLFCFFLLASVSAPKGYAKSAGGAVEHAGREANFRLQTCAAWDRVAVTQTSAGKNPAWIVRFYQTGQTEPDPSFALKTVNGGKDEDLRQTCADFASGYAAAILAQMLDAERNAPSLPGFAVTGSEVKKAGSNEYIFIKFEDGARQKAVYRVMTAMGKYIYSFNFRADSSVHPDFGKNIDLMLETLRPFK